MKSLLSTSPCWRACKEDQLWLYLQPQKSASICRHRSFKQFYCTNFAPVCMKETVTMFSAICGCLVSSSNSITAGSASLWWLEIKTMLWPCVSWYSSTDYISRRETKWHVQYIWNQNNSKHKKHLVRRGEPAIQKKRRGESRYEISTRTTLPQT